MQRPPTAALALAPLPGTAGSRSSEAAARRLRALFDENFELVGRVVRNLGVPASEVDDVVERVFSSAAARLSDIAEGCERGFLLQAAVRWGANARRARARIREVGYDELPDVPDQAASPEELTDGRRAATVLDQLLAAIGTKVAERLERAAEAPVLTRARHRHALEQAKAALERAIVATPPELFAEDLRLATRWIGRITGRVDVEELLDVVFRDFCIGK